MDEKNEGFFTVPFITTLLELKPLAAMNLLIAFFEISNRCMQKEACHVYLLFSSYCSFVTPISFFKGIKTSLQL
jgi:hypothetical protein